MEKPFPLDWQEEIPLNAIPQDGSDLEERIFLAITDDRLGYSFPRGLNFVVLATRTSGGVVLRVSFKCEIAGQCARCLGDAITTVEGEDSFFISVGGDGISEAKAEGFQEEEFWCNLDSWSDRIDLVPILWEVLASSIPFRLVCKDDCLGLCPSCGADLNDGPCGCGGVVTDPRMEVLRLKLQGLGEEK
ncbi:putative metal-binding protein [Thermanaerovibrio velox DSM 12556]|uniref:Putative metal-binding protein n=1 Tax=Thermanaerovibrio velox DSM 12556 TaxID=926567 RepID=H0US34_9BACT|nr:DUF177 domain-containing protein [Thermanaerovibrio velox]EHM10123.1 putative metal-binding protein [Thermanaerovibrio velox DSM 12556]